jgi:hypothetical protein
MPHREYVVLVEGPLVLATGRLRITKLITAWPRLLKLGLGNVYSNIYKLDFVSNGMKGLPVRGTIDVLFFHANEFAGSSIDGNR